MQSKITFLILGGASLLTLLGNFIYRKEPENACEINVKGNKKYLKKAALEILSRKLQPTVIFPIENGFYNGIFGPKYKIEYWSDEIDSIVVTTSETFIGNILFPTSIIILSSEQVESLAILMEENHS